MHNCQTLLENTEPGDILRPGDIYAAMIGEFVSKGKYQAALACMDEMRERLQASNQSVTRYIDRRTLELIYQAVNMPMRPADSMKLITSAGDKASMDPADSLLFEDPIIEASISEISDED
ncbi:unnamed protein product [Dicrocoelium dendriticum]|nr:unnamed protein product [Dicrocoelium dendriticum]